MWLSSDFLVVKLMEVQQVRIRLIENMKTNERSREDVDNRKEGKKERNHESYAIST
jgi:hypothetical protein